MLAKPVAQGFITITQKMHQGLSEKRLISGNVVFGNIKFVTSGIMKSIWITCIIIRSNMALLNRLMTGLIRPFIGMLNRAFMERTGVAIIQ